MLKSAYCIWFCGNLMEILSLAPDSFLKLEILSCFTVAQKSSKEFPI